jgi:PleD family two-component response regulator
MADQPLILLAHGDRWFTESLESVLVQGGYRVITASKRPEVLEQARDHNPDGILLDLGLSGHDGFALCRALRGDPRLSRATPIILLSDGPALRAQQIDALRAGAWELRGQPIDTEELVLRLSAYVQGKREIDRLGTEGLLDPASGMYNSAGFDRRSTEMAALTARHGMPLACVVFRPTEPLRTAGAGDRLALAVHKAGRVSDLIGRTGAEEFTVLAPSTDGAAAEGLVKRLVESVAHIMPVKLRAGVSAAAAAEPRQPPPSPNDLLKRARDALE